MEVWKDVVGFEGIYWVSNKGKIEFKLGAFGRRAMQTHQAAGYERVVLTKEGGRKAFYVHRVVAEAFIHKPEGDYVVNHKDEDKLNNIVDNLEWVSHRYNMVYSAVRLLNSKELEKLKRILNDKDYQ